MAKVTTLVGDLFKSRAQTWVNTVNCVGVMGKGIALGFRERFPEMFRDYERRCEEGAVRLGEPYLYRPEGGKLPWIVNFPTKQHWRAVSTLSDIERGLKHLVGHYREWGIESLAVPPLGCGNGQLDWEIVGPTLYRYLAQLDIPVELYAPVLTPPEQLSLDFLDRKQANKSIARNDIAPPRVPVGAIALVAALSRIYREPYHRPVGRVAFQKLAYFLTEAGVPTGLEFKRSSFGPFSSQLKPLIARLINNGLLREEQEGNWFMVRPGLTYKDARNANKEELLKWVEPIERVADLLVRVEGSRGIELAATAHFAAKTLDNSNMQNGLTERDVFNAVHDWKARRDPPFDDVEIAATIRDLGLLGWLKVRGSEDLPVPSEDPV